MCFWLTARALPGVSALATGGTGIAPTDILDNEGRFVELRWRFSRETMAVLPDIYAALEKMPLAPGLTAPPPLSQVFATR